MFQVEFLILWLKHLSKDTTLIRHLCVWGGSVCLLSGCGFQPLLHQTHTPIHNVSVAPIPDRSGQYLRAKLDALFPNTASHPYQLKIKLDKKIEGLGILKDATYSHMLLTYEAAVVLDEGTPSHPALHTTVTAQTEYNVVTDHPFSTIASAQRAEERALDTLTYQIYTTVVSFLRNISSVSNTPSAQE